MIEALRDNQPPEPFTREYQAKHPRSAQFTKSDGTRLTEQVPFEQLEESYCKYESDPLIGEGPVEYERCVDLFLNAKIEGLRNGLSEVENLELFETPDLDRIIFLLLKGLAKAFE